MRRERISKLYSEMLDLSGYRVEEGQTDFHALSPRSEHHTHTLRIGGRAARWCQPLLQRGGGAEGRHALGQKKENVSLKKSRHSSQIEIDIFHTCLHVIPLTCMNAALNVEKVQFLHLEAIKTSSTSLICFSHLRASHDSKLRS